MLNTGKGLWIIVALLLTMSTAQANICDKFKITQDEVKLTSNNQSINYTWKDFAGSKALKVMATEAGQYKLSLKLKDFANPEELANKINFVIYDLDCNQILNITGVSTLNYDYTADLEVNDVFYIKLFTENKKILLGKRKNNLASLDVIFNGVDNSGSGSSAGSDGDSSSTGGGGDSSPTGGGGDSSPAGGSGDGSELTHRDIVIALNDPKMLYAFDLVDINHNRYSTFEEFLIAAIGVLNNLFTAQEHPGFRTEYDFSNDGRITSVDMNPLRYLWTILLTEDEQKRIPLALGAYSRIDINPKDKDISVEEFLIASIGVANNLFTTKEDPDFRPEYDFNNDGRISTVDINPLRDLWTILLTQEEQNRLQLAFQAYSRIDINPKDKDISVEEFLIASIGVANNLFTTKEDPDFRPEYDFSNDGRITSVDINPLKDLWTILLTEKEQVRLQLAFDAHYRIDINPRDEKISIGEFLKAAIGVRNNLFTAKEHPDFRPEYDFSNDGRITSVDINPLRDLWTILLTQEEQNRFQLAFQAYSRIDISPKDKILTEEEIKQAIENINKYLGEHKDGDAFHPEYDFNDDGLISLEDIEIIEELSKAFF